MAIKQASKHTHEERDFVSSSKRRGKISKIPRHISRRSLMDRLIILLDTQRISLPYRHWLMDIWKYIYMHAHILDYSRDGGRHINWFSVGRGEASLKWTTKNKRLMLLLCVLHWHVEFCTTIQTRAALSVEKDKLKCCKFN